MKTTRSLLARLTVLALGSVMASCAAPGPERCHRYDAVSLTRENGFAGSFEWKGGRLIDARPERVEVALTIVRPLRGPVELVHVRGDVETDRWVLTVPDVKNVASGICWIMAPGGSSNCGATLQDPPFFPGGYYHLRPNGNTVLEAGLAFYVCDP